MCYVFLLLLLLLYHIPVEIKSDYQQRTNWFILVSYFIPICYTVRLDTKNTDIRNWFEPLHYYYYVNNLTTQFPYFIILLCAPMIRIGKELVLAILFSFELNIYLPVNYLLQIQAPNCVINVSMRFKHTYQSSSLRILVRTIALISVDVIYRQNFDIFTNMYTWIFSHYSRTQVPMPYPICQCV